MIEQIALQEELHLDDYGNLTYLSGVVQNLKLSAQTLAPKLKGRTVWMLNSTARGGGVAEMMPCLIKMLSDLHVRTKWLVMGARDPAFFEVTKRIHNLIHDFGAPGFSARDKSIYQAATREAADSLAKIVDPEDILVIHDPQPLGVGAELKRRIGIRTIWRCHIGLDRHTPATESAWKFLQPHALTVDHAVFSAVEYIPPYLVGKASVIHPAIDPLSHKNRELSAHKLVGILCNAGLMKSHHPVLTPNWDHQALRLNPDGQFLPAHAGGGIGMMFRPVIAQISRWDHLKGWIPLLEGFLKLKKRYRHHKKMTDRHHHRIEISRLVLAGPDPSGIQDDPEGQEVLTALCQTFFKMKPEEQKSVVLLSLPMASIKQNHLLVNVIQRCATVVVQNSLQEGFGLTVTEAMWKRIPVMGSSACGLRQQIRDRIDGCLTSNPRDPDEIADILDDMLSNPIQRDLYGRNAQRRVYDHFLVFTQVENWLRVLADTASRARLAAEPF
ncbi:MAG: glycosyltransferase [Desulfatirhabdiaceae bacterium]